jgi:hypothetical protein
MRPGRYVVQGGPAHVCTTRSLRHVQVPAMSDSTCAPVVSGDVPQWVVDALDVAGISLEGITTLRPAHRFYEEVPEVPYITPQ